jgi:poly(3-hydroxybutyrate) depolymerase
MGGLSSKGACALVAVLVSVSACSESSDGDVSDAGGVDAGVATGGASGGGSGGGASGSGGETSSGGSGGTVSGTGGGSTGGASSTGGTASSDSGAEDAGPARSAGCGTASPASGILSFQVAGQDAEYVLSIPPDYDENRAYPLGFAFHGRNRTGPNCHDGDCAGFQSAMENDAVLVYMTSLGGTGWEGDGEREINVQFYQELVAHVKSTYCIDEDRVFVAGTSSGAHFVNVLACRFGDELLAVAPVAGYLPEREDCSGEVAALVIHGYADIHVVPSSGEEARDFFVERNGCTTTAVPPVSETHDSVVNNPESHQCSEYQGCDPGKPVIWCEHSEGGYDGSTHGWPLFGGARIWEFVQSL